MPILHPLLSRNNRKMPEIMTHLYRKFLCPLYLSNTVLVFYLLGYESTMTTVKFFVAPWCSDSLSRGNPSGEMGRSSVRTVGRTVKWMRIETTLNYSNGDIEDYARKSIAPEQGSFSVMVATHISISTVCLFSVKDTADRIIICACCRIYYTPLAGSRVRRCGIVLCTGHTSASETYPL